MRRFLAAAAGIAISMVGSVGSAQTVYPIDRADILVGARFDFKVEFASLADPTKVSVTLNGKDHAELFGKAATFVEREDGKDQSALILRDASLAPPGVYRLRVSDGANSRELEWNVYDSGPRRAKNVILFIGDGMSLAHRVAARVLAKGIAEGKARGKLAIDDMPHMALVATAGSDSIITDSGQFRQRLCDRPQVGGQRHGGLCRSHLRPARRSQGRDHLQSGQAQTWHGGRHRHQYRDRGCHPRRDGGPRAPAQRIRPHRGAILRRQTRRDHGRWPRELPAEVRGRRQAQG